MNHSLSIPMTTAFYTLSVASTSVWRMVNWWPIVFATGSGVILGFLSTLVLRDRGVGVTVSLVVGFLGGFLGLFLFPSVDHAVIGPLEATLRGLSGALLFLVASKLKKRSRRSTTP